MKVVQELQQYTWTSPQSNLRRARRAVQHYRWCCSGGFAFVLLHVFTWISLQPPTSIFNLNTPKEREFDTEFNGVPCVRKYYQFFTHESIINQYVSASVCRHCKVLDENFAKRRKPRQKQPLSLEARGLPSNTWMPGPMHPTHHAKRQLDRCTQFHTTTQQSLHWLQWDAANSPPNCPFTTIEGPPTKLLIFYFLLMNQLMTSL